MNFLNNIIKIIFLRPKCTICKKFGSYLCKDCENELNIAFNPVIVNTTHKNVICTSPFIYNGSIRKIIHKYKFENQKNLFKILSPFLLLAIQKQFNDQKFDLITSVPLYFSSLNERKYNQSELLGLELSKQLKIPYENCLIKVKKNKIQHGLSFHERQLNVKNIFKSVKDYHNKNILLCDDIITTGATLSECVKVLQKSNATVKCVTVAYTLNKL